MKFSIFDRDDNSKHNDVDLMHMFDIFAMQHNLSIRWHHMINIRLLFMNCTLLHLPQLYCYWTTVVVHTVWQVWYFKSLVSVWIAGSGNLNYETSWLITKCIAYLEKPIPPSYYRWWMEVCGITTSKLDDLVHDHECIGSCVILYMYGFFIVYKLVFCAIRLYKTLMNKKCIYLNGKRGCLSLA